MIALLPGSRCRNSLLPLSKIAFHAAPGCMGLRGISPWKVQAFPRTFHAHPSPSALCGLLPWKVILFSIRKLCQEGLLRPGSPTRTYNFSIALLRASPREVS